MLVRNNDDEDVIIFHDVKHFVRKAIKQESPKWGMLKLPSQGVCKDALGGNLCLVLKLRAQS